MRKYNDLDIRMKKYEHVNRAYLPIRTPVLVRIDGKGFSSYTKSFEKPWSPIIRDAFISACEALYKEISGLKLIYSQSDELSLLITTYDKFETTPWFENNISKIISVSASITTAAFNHHIDKLRSEEIAKNKKSNLPSRRAVFDSRVWTVPKEEVCNYFWWRETDCIRNSISGLAQKHFSAKQLYKVNTAKMKEMLLEKGIDWEACENWQKRGFCVVKNTIEKEGAIRCVIEPDWNIPNFSEDRNYINKFVYVGEERAR